MSTSLKHEKMHAFTDKQMDRLKLITIGYFLTADS